MAITSVKETFTRRDGDRGETTSALRRQFIVQTDSVRTAQKTILNDARLPRINSYYNNGEEVDSRYLAKRIIPTQNNDSPLVWDVTVEYELFSGEALSSEPNPVLRPATMTWTTAQVGIDLTVDATGYRAENSNGDPFDPAIPSQKAQRVLIYERAERTWNPSLMDTYVNTVCKSELFGYAAREAKMEAINATAEFDAEYGAYWKVTYEIHFRRSAVWQPSIDYDRMIPQNTFSASNNPGPWAEYVRNVGWRYRNDDTCDPDADTGCLRPAETGGLQDVQPIDLKQTGEKLDDGALPWWVVLQPYLPKSWTPLNLT